MKICSCCGDEKPVKDFNFRNKAKGIRHSYCAECGKQKTRKHYKDNVKAYTEKAKKHTQANKEFLRRSKEVPCKDCGNEYPYYVMDFDHTDNKDFTISENGHRRGINVLKKEVRKCDVVCANCHRERTHQRSLLL